MIENDDLDTEAEAPAVETVAPKGNYFDRYDPAPAAADPTAPLFGAAAPVQPTVDTADIMGGAERRIRLSEQMAADGSLDVLAARLRKQRMMSSPMSAVPTEAETKARTAEWDGVLSDLGRAAERDPTVAADLDQATRAKAAEEAPKPYRIYEGMPAAEREKAIAAQAKWLQGSFGEDGVFSDGWGKLTPEQQAEWVESTRADAEAEVDDVDKRLADLEARAYTTPDGKKGIRAPRGTGLSYDTAKASLLREREKALGKRALIEAIDAGKADPATKTWYRSGAENIAKGVGADLLGGMIEFAGIARGYATRAVKGGDFDPASDALYLTGRQLRNLTETAFPGDPMRERELAQQVARGLGQMAGIYGSAGVAAVLKLGPAGMAAVATLAGSSIEASQQFQAATDKMVAWDAKIAAAKEEGAPPEAIARMRANPPVSERERVLAVIFGSIVGASESVPLLTNWTRGLGPAFETGVSGILAKGVEQSIEEGIQEFGQTYASDAVARWLYDPEREVGEQAADSALVGAILGFGFGSGTAAITEIGAKRSGKTAGAAKPEAKPTPEELPPELTMPEAVVPAALDDQDIDLAAEETGLPPEKVREALPFAAMITDDGGGPDAIARATRAAETAEDPEVLRALEALTPRAVRKAKASATPAPSEPALPEPEAAPTPPEFDPYSTSLLGTLMREGREPLVARLEQIGSVSQLREMASAQQITLSADMWESETVDVPTLASAIADGVQVRLNDRMAAAESSKRVEVPKAERVARKSTLGKGMAEVAAETAASGARAKAEKVMAEPGTEFSPAALLMKDGEEALADRLDEMSLAEIKRLVTAQKIEAPAKRGALVRAVMDHARARVSDRMAAADGPAPGQPRPVAGDREVAAPTDRAPAAAAPEARETASVITPDGGMEVEVRPEIVDLSTLTAAAGDLQPRDRSRAESDLGIQERAARLDPAQLMAGRVSDAGAPIISADGVVLSGNGRIASIRKAYEAFPERAAAYRKAIGAGPGMAMPVLVQRIVTPLDREGMARFADLSNRTRIAGMSATERAIRDARSAGPEIMGLYQGGDFQAEPNREFYRLFMDAVVTSAERGTISRDGRLTKEGHDRMAAAVLAAAYGDPSALAQMLESTDDNIKALSNAMREAAGAFVRLKAGIAAGVVKPDLDITPQIAEAALLISRLRDQGVKPAAHFAQIDAFSRPDPIVEEIVRLIYSENLTRPVSQKIMTEAFLFYANEAIKHQVGGFIADETQAADIIRLAKERLTNAAQNDLFATRSEPVQAGARPSQGAEPAGEPRGAEPEPAGRSPERLRSEFYDILEGKLPRKQWAGALGVTEAELAPLIDDAVAAKWLRRRGRDVYRSPAKTRPARPDAPDPVAPAVPERTPLASAPRFTTRQTKPRKGAPQFVASFVKAPTRAVLREATRVATSHGGTAVAKKGKTQAGFQFPSADARAAFLDEITYGKPVPVAEYEGAGPEPMFAIMGTPQEELARGARIDRRRFYVDMVERVRTLAENANDEGRGTPEEHIAAWIAQRTKPEDGRSITMAMAYESYAEWAEEAGVPALALPTFTRALQESGYRQHRIGGRARILGLTTEIERRDRLPARFVAKLAEARVFTESEIGEIASDVRPGWKLVDALKGFIERMKARLVGPAVTTEEAPKPAAEAAEIEWKIALAERMAVDAANDPEPDPPTNVEPLFAIGAQPSQGEMRVVEHPTWKGFAIQHRDGRYYSSSGWVDWFPTYWDAEDTMGQRGGLSPRAVFDFGGGMMVGSAAPDADSAEAQAPPSGIALDDQKTRLISLIKQTIREGKDGSRLPLSPTLKAAVMPLIEKTSPDAVAARAKEQGFTLHAWHSGASGFVTFQPYRVNSDYGFHVAIRRPNAADRDGSVYRLLVNPGRSIRMPDIGTWYEIGDWLKGVADPEFRGPEAFKQWLRDLQAFPFTQEEQDTARREYTDPASRRMMQEMPAKLAELGIGSIIYKNQHEDEGVDSLMLVDPTRVRAAIDMFYPEAVGASSIMASEPFLDADIRTALNAFIEKNDIADEPLFAIGAQPPDIDSLGYYSKALEAARLLKQAKGTPEQMLAQLKSAGVKDAEIEATKLGEFLAGKPAVTRDEIVSFLTENMVKLQGRVTGRTADQAEVTRLTKERIAKWEQSELEKAEFEYDRRPDDTHVYRHSDEWRAFAEQNGLKVDDEVFDDDPMQALADAGMTWRSGTVPLWEETDSFLFGVTPDGSVAVRSEGSGFEVLKKGETVESYIAELEDSARRHIESDIIRADPQDMRLQIRQEVESELGESDPTKWSAYSRDPANPTYREIVLYLPKTGKGDFQSGHFPEPNITGHMMVSEVTTPDGKGTLLIDQIQSDWGQGLRTGGVRDEAKIAEMRLAADEAKRNLDDVNRQIREFVSIHAPQVAKRNVPGLYGTTLQNANENALRQIADRSRLDSWGKVANQVVSDDPEWTPEVFATARKWADELSAAKGLNDRLAAELRTAEASVTGHPLVNTTDQWVDTTLRRGLTEAVRSGKDYIAIPSGKAVLAYNPGDEAGMEGFYDKIVPKNLRKLLEKLDKSTPAAERVETLLSPSGSAGRGNGFVVFRITPEAKRKILEEGQPLFAAGGMASDAHARHAAHSELQAGRDVAIDPSVMKAVWDAAKPHLWIVPKDVPVAVLKGVDSFDPQQVADYEKVYGAGSASGRAIGVFEDSAGTEIRRVIPHSLVGARALAFHPAGNSPGFIALVRFSGTDFRESVAGELRHELVHVLRRLKKISPLVWGKLLAHAKALRILDSDLATYLAMVKDPTAAHATGTVLDKYTTLYKGRRDFSDAMDEEYVAHLMELAYHRELLPVEIEPIRAEIEAFLAGDISGTAAARPKARVSLGGGPAYALTGRPPVPTLPAEADSRLIARLQDALNERNHQDDIGRGRQGGAGDNVARFLRSLVGESEVAAEGKPGSQEGMARSDGGDEAPGRARIDDSLRAEALRLLGDDYTPDAIRARAESQGFTVRAWHGGTNSLDRIVIARGAGWKGQGSVQWDYGFHVALGRPEAANSRVGYSSKLLARLIKGTREVLDGGRVYPLLVNPGKSLRMPDIERWLWASNWQKGMRSKEFDGPAELRQWIDDIIESSPDSASADKAMRDRLPAKLAEYGYGSIVYKNTWEDKGHDSMLIVDSTRVRSAFDLFHPDAVGADGLMASEPAVRRDMRKALNDYAMDNGLIDEPVFAIGGSKLDDEPSLNDIIAEVKRVLDLGVTQGLWGVTVRAGNRTINIRPPKGMRGQYRRGTGGISVRQSRDIGAIAHEGGHALEARYPELRTLMETHRNELAGMTGMLADYAAAAPVSEGFSEFFRSYLVSPDDAKAKAPRFYEAFEEFLDAGDVGLLGDLKDIQEAYKAYVALDPLAAMARDVVTDADRSLWSQMASGEAFKSIHGWLGTAYTALIDDLSPVAKTVRKLLDLADANGVRDADGKPLSLPVGENVYKLFRLFKDSYAQGRIWLTYGVTDLGGTVPKGPSLHDALVKAFGGTHRSQWSKKAFADFDAYLIARRAVAEYDRLEAKAKEIGVGTERLASLSDGRPLLARARDEASGRLDRRERALIRLNAVDAAHRREQASLARKADNLAQEYDLDPSIGDRRRANIRAELRVIEKRLTWLAERVGDADEMRSRLVAERDQAKGDLASARQRLTTRDAGIETTKRDLDRARKRGASRPPTLQGKAHHQAVIEQADREHPEWADAAGMVNEFVHRLLTVRHQAGMITDEMFEMLSERKGWYVPFMRDMSDAEPEVAFSGMAGDRRRWSPFKKFDGSDRAILSPLSVISQEAYVVARQIAYNDAVKAFDRLVTRAGPGSAAIAERLEQPIDLGDDPFQRIQDIAIGMGIDPADASILVARMEQETTHERISAMMAPQGGAPKALPVLPMWEGGRRVMLRLTDPEFGADLFNAINGLGKEFSTFLVDMAAAPARILRLGVTAHPDFMFRNLIRDLFAGFILTGAPPVLTHLRGFYHMAANTEFARNYASAGGIMAGEAVASISKAKDRLDISRLRKRGYKVSASVHGLYSIVGSIETAGRLGLAAHAYKRAKEHNPALTEWQAMQEAAFVARDVIDYGRRGSRMLATARLVTFLNAQIQGLDKAARALGGQGDRGSVIRRYMEVLRKRDDAVPLSKDEERLLGASVKLYARLAAVNLFLYALYLLYADDEEYKDVNDIKKSGMQPVKILGEWMFLPKPFELALPGNLMEIATDAITERDPRWAERMRESLFQTLAPPAVPQAFRLWRDMSTNIDAHSGREIVPSHLKDLAPHLQFDAWTSQLARDFSKALFDAGVPESAIPAPPMIDYLLTAGGAYLGREIQNDYAVIGRAAKGEEPIAGDWRDFMVIRGLTGDPERMSSSVKRFWDLMSKQGGKLVRAAATYDELLKTAKPEEAIAYLFSDRLSPEQRAYAIVDQHYGNAEKRMHPMVRLESVMRIASKIASEALLDRLDDGGEPIRLTPSRKEEALDIISRIKRDEAVNTLRLMGEPGWTTRKGFSVEAALDELGALDPRLRKIYEDRLADKHVVAFDDVAEGWPEFRKEVLGLKPEDLDSMPRRKGRTSREDVPASP